MSDEKQNTSSDQSAPERLNRRAVVAPAVDIFENDDEILVVADVPGARNEGLNVHYDKSQLFIEASTTAVDDEVKPMFREFGAVDYRRVFELAPGVDVEGIAADLKSGVLSIHLPKSAAVKPRKIAIAAE